MFKVLGVFPKDLWVSLDFPLGDLKKIQKTLSLASVFLNRASENDEETEARRYVMQEFLPALSKLIEDIENGSGSNS